MRVLATRTGRWPRTPVSMWIGHHGVCAGTVPPWVTSETILSISKSQFKLLSPCDLLNSNYYNPHLTDEKNSPESSGVVVHFISLVRW